MAAAPPPNADAAQGFFHAYSCLLGPTCPTGNALLRCRCPRSARDIAKRLAAKPVGVVPGGCWIHPRNLYMSTHPLLWGGIGNGQFQNDLPGSIVIP
jgi:hypothetical protein